MTVQDIKANALLEEVMTLTNRLAEARTQVTVLNMEKQALEKELEEFRLEQGYQELAKSQEAELDAPSKA